jgi:putative GTP pyrophosphokinase
VERSTRLKEDAGRARVARIYDYIAQPKASGYRGVHLVVTYHGFLAEMQVRTEVQHEWAIAVERVGGRMHEDLKGGHGPRPVLDFFGLVSQAMALEEAGVPVPRVLMERVREARRLAEPLMKRYE